MTKKRIPSTLPSVTELGERYAAAAANGNTLLNDARVKPDVLTSITGLEVRYRRRRQRLGRASQRLHPPSASVVKMLPFSR